MSEIQLVWQPIVRLADRQAIGWEALLRHPDMPTQDYIRRATEQGRALAVDAAVLTALAQGPVPDEGLLFINLLPSTIQVLAEGHRILDLPDALVRRVVWELSEEPGWPHDARSAVVIRRGLPGGRLALDDVGAGWRDLERMLLVRPDYIKLARTLVADIGRDPARQAVVRGLLATAVVVGAVVIAEGVETEEEAETVQRLGVPLAQGFLFSSVDNHTI